jgi:hypothetical protein
MAIIFFIRVEFISLVFKECFHLGFQHCLISTVVACSTDNLKDVIGIVDIGLELSFLQSLQNIQKSNGHLRDGSLQGLAMQIEV